MDISAVAEASIDMHLAQAQSGVNIALTKKAMDVQETQAVALLEMMRQPVSFGQRIDTYI